MGAATGGPVGLPRLEPLSDADTAGLIAALLGRAVARDQAHATLLGRIGGNPLNAEQVCRMLDDRGLLEGDGGTLRLVAADTVLPDSLQALIAARLDTLAPELRALLQDAAVVGTVFWPGRCWPSAAATPSAPGPTWTSWPSGRSSGPPAAPRLRPRRDRRPRRPRRRPRVGGAGLRLGLGRGTALAYGNLGAELFELEGPAAGMRAMEAGLELCRRRGINEVAHWLSVSVVECLFDLGRWDDDIGDPQVTSNILPIAAFIEQSGGSRDAALALVEELERATRDGPACYRADPLPMVARICRAADQPELAERFLAGADAPAARYRHCLATARAVLAETKGDPQVALGRYAEATGSARAPLGREALGRARAIFDHLGATILVAETDRQLAQTAT